MPWPAVFIYYLTIYSYKYSWENFCDIKVKLSTHFVSLRVTVVTAVGYELGSYNPAVKLKMVLI